MFFGSTHNVELKIHPDTKFIDSIEGFSDWSKDKKSLVQEYYYRWLRKKYSLLMDGKNPLGGKWNYDKDNQKSISKLKDPPEPRPSLKSDELTISIPFASSVGPPIMAMGILILLQVLMTW